MKLSNDNNITRREFVRNTAAAMAAVSACNVSTAYAEDKAKERWNMKLATSSVMFEDLPIEQVCERAARLGLTGLDIWGPFGKCQHLEDIKKRLDGKGLRELMTKHKLDVAAFTVYTDRYPQYWELIRDFGGGIVVRSADAGRLTDPKQLPSRMKAFFEKLKPQIELAEKGNARLAIENHGGDLLNTFDSFKAFVELNPNPKRVGIALAPYHLQVYKTPMADFIKTAGAQCLFFYSWQIGKSIDQMPGVGPADFTPWIGALAEINYSHYSTIFMHGHLPADKMEASVAESEKYLLKCRAES